MHGAASSSGPSNTTRSIVDALGGRTVLSRVASTPEELIDEIREGLPYASLETLGHRFGFAREELAETLDIPLRTLARRKRQGKLRSDESDRLIRLARVAARASEILGGEEKAARWLHRPNRSLGGESPLHLLDTDVGSRRVEQVLGRIEHGIVG